MVGADGTKSVIVMDEGADLPVIQSKGEMRFYDRSVSQFPL